MLFILFEVVPLIQRIYKVAKFEGVISRKINEFSVYNYQKHIYRVFVKYCVFFPKNSRKFVTSPSTALGCYWLYKKLPDIGVPVHSYCVERFEGFWQRCRRGMGLWKKTQFFLNTLYINSILCGLHKVARLSLIQRRFSCWS